MKDSCSFAILPLLCPWPKCPVDTNMQFMGNTKIKLGISYFNCGIRMRLPDLMRGLRKLKNFKVLFKCFPVDEFFDFSMNKIWIICHLSSTFQSMFLKFPFIVLISVFQSLKNSCKFLSFIHLRYSKENSQHLADLKCFTLLLEYQCRNQVTGIQVENLDSINCHRPWVVPTTVK